MTKSTITREQLEEWVAQFEEDGGCDATDRQLEALIRQSLAAMNSEPVAYIFKHPAGRLFWALTDESNKGQNDVMPVYASPQPAPVVQDGYVMVPKEPTSEMVKKMRYHVGSYDRNIKDGYKAMLAASPQEVTNGK
ncbi:TPA: hypothetical protein RRI33_001061 [Klebsiella pneumoniae]|uniref:hypothetical protein n=1 Tax=Klebsiella pneumoniae TaxID=573 RepID=UPI0028C5E86E|nr:hypothetical protein [Klebsiella pneumoniae]HDY8919816.1 hypothetical protein [Klebsiella pneumoniae]